MDSQPSGNDSELLFIETEEVYFSIKGNNQVAKYGESKSLTIIVEGKELVDDIYKCLYFKEYTNYELVIERKNKTTIEFYHQNPNIRNKVTPTGRGGNILSGIINFRGDIGYSDLYVKDEYFKDRTVIVGSLRNKEQLEMNLKGKFYHTKCSNVNLAQHNIKFVALAQSKR